MTFSSARSGQGFEMDQDKAQVLFELGATFVLMDFPEGSEFGIDYNCWVVGSDFRGVKMIPPGIHFIYFSSVNSEGQFGPRSGFFYNFSAKEMVVKKWDKKMEDFKDDPVPDEELQRYESNKYELDKYLGPYPYDRYKEWVSLTNHISKDIVNLLHPDCGHIYSVAQFESEVSTTQSRQTAAASKIQKMETEDVAKVRKPSLPKLKRVGGTQIKYSLIPRKRYPEGATPGEVSKHSLDSSYVLDIVLSERFDKQIEKLLGEVQFAFVCFLLGQNYDSFEQWKKLVHLLCSSADAITVYPQAYKAFITNLHFQIREIPSDFFVDIVTSHNFLTVTLHELFQNLQGDNVDPKLRKKGFSFQKHLTDKFNWDFTAEPDDCAPIIVDC